MIEYICIYVCVRMSTTNLINEFKNILKLLKNFYV